MKATLRGRTPYDDSSIEDTEIALAISPCPKLEDSKDTGDGAGMSGNHGTRSARRGAGRRSQRGVFEQNGLIGALTIGWAVALAMAVAVVIYVSGA